MGVEYRGRIKAPSSSYRVCSVCKKKHGAVYPFPGTLKYHGISGENATVACIRLIAQKSVKEVMDARRPEASDTEIERARTARVTEIYQQLASNRRSFRKYVMDG